MKNYMWIFGLFIPFIIVPIIVGLLIVILKVAKSLLNKWQPKIDKMIESSQPVQNKTFILIGKISIEVLVGITIFYVCLRILSLPILFLISIRGPDWTPPTIICIALITLPFALSAMVTYKTIRYVHKYLEVT
jgi:hypothetical protein